MRRVTFLTDRVDKGGRVIGPNVVAALSSNADTEIELQKAIVVRLSCGQVSTTDDKAWLDLANKVIGGG